MYNDERVKFQISKPILPFILSSYQNKNLKNNLTSFNIIEATSFLTCYNYNIYIIRIITQNIFYLANHQIVNKLTKYICNVICKIRPHWHSCVCLIQVMCIDWLCNHVVGHKQRVFNWTLHMKATNKVFNHWSQTRAFIIGRTIVIVQVIVVRIIKVPVCYFLGLINKLKL